MPGMWAGVSSLCCYIWLFMFRVDAPLLYFRGGAVRFSFFLVAFGLLVLFLVVCWALPFW